MVWLKFISKCSKKSARVIEESFVANDTLTPCMEVIVDEFRHCMKLVISSENIETYPFLIS